MSIEGVGDRWPAERAQGPKAKSGLVPDGIAARLEELRADYASINGSPFEHFYCPILYRDEEVPLCKAHIVNRAFDGAPKDWTVQRRDVDNHFGSRFESTFSLLDRRDQILEGDVFGKEERAKGLKTRLYAGDEEVPYFPSSSKPGPSFTPLWLEESGLVVYLRMTSAEVERRIEDHWHFETSSGDIRVPVAVSFIKAAHLTLFSQVGYTYALSAGGHLVGREILGAVFTATRNLRRSDAEERAREILSKWVHMVRPVLGGALATIGTIRDRFALFACTGSGHPWAGIVKVPVGGGGGYAVLMPCSSRPDELATYLDFLDNEREEIRVKLARLGGEGEGVGTIAVSKDEFPLVWPKSGESFDLE